MMDTEFFNHIDINIDNTHLLAGDSPDPVKTCSDYEWAIQNSGGIDIQLLGIGRNGHIGFNEPSSCLNSRTRIKTLTQATIADNSQYFNDQEFQPQLALTMGIGTILDAQLILLLATGEHKAEAVKAMIEGPLSAWCPASALQMHQAVVIIIDQAAASKLSDPNFFKHIEQQNHVLCAQLNAID
jgi:glucosamine-6-phosphate deaminase